MHLSLVEFAYKNSYYASIGMVLYEALYGRRCQIPLCWDEVGVRLLRVSLLGVILEGVEEKWWCMRGDGST